jgi:hypothetical protein
MLDSQIVGVDLARLTTGDLVDRWRKSAATREDVTLQIAVYQELLARGDIDTLVPMLPLLLHWNGAPYTLDNHFHFEELFRVRYAKKTVWKTARQVAKTTGQGSSSLLRSASIPNYSTLFVTPLFEQVKRISSDYVGKFIAESPIRRLLVGAGTKNNVLQRSFQNLAKMYFSFAGLSCDRIRGISCHEVRYDEIQDMHREHIPIIEATMSASPYEISVYTGTSKTEDGILEGLWNKSSGAEWFIPCMHCTTGGFPTWNIPTLEHHLLAMIEPTGNFNPLDVSPYRPALRCHKCRGRISPRFGRWVHGRPEQRFKFDGYHIPQPVVPLHCEDPEKWIMLLSKLKNYPTAKLHNEIFGEACDMAAKLVTQSDLQRIAQLGPNDHVAAKRWMKGYRYVTLGIDWGGGGEEEISWTCLALVGIRLDGRIDILWGKRLLTPNDHIREAKEILYWWKFFKPDFLAHDYNGSGQAREAWLHQAKGGVKLSQIMGCVYGRGATHKPVRHVPPTPLHARDHYHVDRTRVLLLVTSLIKMGWIQAFDYDYVDADNTGLLYDFVALTQANVDTSTGSMYRIDRQEGLTDDFAHAVTFACVNLWHRMRNWPDLPEINALLDTERRLLALDGGEWDPEDYSESMAT